MVRHEACPALLHCLKSAPYSLAATDKVLSHPSLPAGLTPICLSYQLQGTFGLRSHPHPICLVLMEGRLLKCEPEHIHYICWPLEPICPPLIRPQAPGCSHYTALPWGVCGSAQTLSALPVPRSYSWNLSLNPAPGMWLIPCALMLPALSP